MKTKEFYKYTLAGVIVIGFFALLVILILIVVPEPNKDLLNITVGTLLSSFSMIVGYFFGSSKSSDDKNEIIQKLTNQQPTTNN